MNVPATINVAHARLPATYEQAKVALSNCARIDECQEWANKAEALASYAKMADDDSLRQMADRIQARAVRRAGELLKQVDGQGARTDKLTDGADSKLTQKQLARDAGMSERQQVTAVRVANVPEEKFEAAVEAEKPATVTKLAEMGKQVRPQHKTPDGFKEATAALGSVERFAEFCRKHDPVFVAGGVLAAEVDETKEQVAIIDAWLDRFVTNLKRVA